MTECDFVGFVGFGVTGGEIELEDEAGALGGCVSNRGVEGGEMTHEGDSTSAEGCGCDSANVATCGCDSEDMESGCELEEDERCGLGINGNGSGVADCGESDRDARRVSRVEGREKGAG